MAKKIGRPSELQPCLERARAYLGGEYLEAGDIVPSIAGLASHIGKSRQSLYNYAAKSEEFLDTLEGIKNLQAVKLINGGLRGELNASIAKLMLANHGYR